MNIVSLLRQLSLFILLLFIHQNGYAKEFQAEKGYTDKVQQWMNESTATIIPTWFLDKASSHYTNRTIFSKYLGVLKPLFNEHITQQDRSGYITYLLQNFSEEEVPHMLLHELQLSLIQSQQHK
jgi:hypothetical protein